MTTAAEFDAKYNIIDAPTPRHTLMSGKYKQSFAYFTLLERLPVTLTSIVDNLSRTKDELCKRYGEQSREEILTVVCKLSKLKYQLQTDKPLGLLEDEEADKELWNTFIGGLPEKYNSYFKTCWLYAECYMYRRIASFFAMSKSLKSFDYFAQQKMRAAEISIPAMELVASHTRQMERNEATFVKLVKLNLWGNRCDLSITSGKEVKPTDDPLSSIDVYNENLLVDNTAKIWSCLSNAGEDSIVDIICDNAGYELYTDFVIAEYIIDKKLAAKVRFHVKAIPWFISDVTSEDFHWTLKFLVEQKTPVLSEVGQKWERLYKEGKFELVPTEHFWTSPYEFHRMQEIKPELYNKIAESRLAIFKGDLNYRKLIGDYTWDFTESFETCLRGFLPTNLCTLRTVKADLICGLKPGQAEELFKKQKNWMLTGEFGVIQFASVHS